VTPRDLAARQGAPIALGWLDAATDALGRPDDPLTAAALAINFSVQENFREVAAEIRATYEKARGILLQSDRYFVGVREEVARRLFPGGIPPAYAIFDEAIYFTPRFEPHDPTTGHGFGPMCRAAMVLHESIHVIDPESGTPDVHISEWDEPGFSAQTLEESLHNPSAYASFAAQIHERAMAWPREARFGAGRPGD
jgi:hypothetical protein